MADVEKQHLPRSLIKRNRLTAIKRSFYDSHLPPLKPVIQHNIPIKNEPIYRSKRHVTTTLPPIVREMSSNSVMANASDVSTAVTTNIEEASTVATTNTHSNFISFHEAAKKLMLRNNMVKFSQQATSVDLANNVIPKRSKLYQNIRAKIDTGIRRLVAPHSVQSTIGQMEPIYPVKWSALKQAVEMDENICQHTRNVRFSSGIMYEKQISTIGDLIRSKVKSYLLKENNIEDLRYKLVVQLTVFPKTAGGLHLSSRCLWNANTDNSITIKIKGVDCYIIAVIFICYKEL